MRQSRPIQLTNHTAISQVLHLHGMMTQLYLRDFPKTHKVRINLTSGERMFQRAGALGPVS